MPRKTAKSQGIRTEYGSRAKIPHIVKGCVPVQTEVTDEKGTRRLTILATASAESKIDPFPTKRAAQRAIENTLRFVGGTRSSFKIARVY
jgi:hypothetical protein